MVDRLNKCYKIISISDIHFGVLDPVYMYNNLQEQFVKRIAQVDFDILAICGDLFDGKFMSNNIIISYALSFIDNLVNMCRDKKATLILIEGTPSHDSGQFKLFYHYLSDPSVDVRIIETPQFIWAQGLRLLCIPERYGLPEEFYRQLLFFSGSYDMCFLHGTFRGSFSGSEISTLNNNGKAPIFALSSFCNCMGPIIMGHYHISGCYESYAYYNGSAFRYQFGEEQEKGFLATVYNPVTRYHITQLVPIISLKYMTISIDDIINNDPKMIIDYIKNYQLTNGADYVRVQFNTTNENMNIVQQYFRTDPTIVLQELNRRTRIVSQANQVITEQNAMYSYLTDPNISDYQKFVMYMNQQENCEFMTVDELISILEMKL